jgi:hypothetical protein
MVVAEVVAAHQVATPLKLMALVEQVEVALAEMVVEERECNPLLVRQIPDLVVAVAVGAVQVRTHCVRVLLVLVDELYLSLLNLPRLSLRYR